MLEVQPSSARRCWRPIRRRNRSIRRRAAIQAPSPSARGLTARPRRAPLAELSPRPRALELGGGGGRASRTRAGALPRARPADGRARADGRRRLAPLLSILNGVAERELRGGAGELQLAAAGPSRRGLVAGAPVPRPPRAPGQGAAAARASGGADWCRGAAARASGGGRRAGAGAGECRRWPVGGGRR